MFSFDLCLCHTDLLNEPAHPSSARQQHKNSGFRQERFAKQFLKLFLSRILSLNLIIVPWSLRVLPLDPQLCPVRTGLLTLGFHSTFAFTFLEVESPTAVGWRPPSPTPTPPLVNKPPPFSPAKPILFP